MAGFVEPDCSLNAGVNARGTGDKQSSESLIISIIHGKMMRMPAITDCCIASREIPSCLLDMRDLVLVLLLPLKACREPDICYV